MNHAIAFPKALGGGIVITASRNIPSELRERMAARIEEFERALSRFRDDSIVADMARAAHGGRFAFPDFARPLFEFYDRLYAASQGAIDPCVGEDLARLGYDANLTFRMESGAFAHLGQEHGRATWSSVRRNGTTLITTGPVQLDFGAAGKGLMVDLLGGMMEQHALAATRLDDDGCGTIGGDGDHADARPLRYVIDAGGDLRIRVHDASPENGRHTDDRRSDFGERPARIALEDPDDTTRAIGVLTLTNASLCASAPSRRHWPVHGTSANPTAGVATPAASEATAALREAHHLLNAIDGLPADEVRASWVLLDGDNSSDDNTHEPYPTMVADGLATALFVTSAAALAQSFNFQCALVTADRVVAKSPGFPGRFFMK